MFIRYGSDHNSYIDVPIVGTFDLLEDTPNSKTGQALKVVRVNAAEDALEYADPVAANQAIYLYASLAGFASSTVGLLTKASDIGSTANPSGKAITSAGDPGLNNGGSIGYLVPESGLEIKEITIKLAGAAVSTSTVGTPILKIRIFRQNYSTRTQLGSDITITISPTGVGTFNNTSGDAFQTASSSALSISVNKGDSIGWEFLNVPGDGNINAVSRLITILKLA
jgi:hypothetical protein